MGFNLLKNILRFKIEGKVLENQKLLAWFQSQRDYYKANKLLTLWRIDRFSLFEGIWVGNKIKKDRNSKNSTIRNECNYVLKWGGIR